MSEWHCAVDGKQYEPVNDDILRLWIAQGRVKRADMVWKDGMTEWQQAGSVAELLDAFSAAPTGGAPAGSAMSASPAEPASYGPAGGTCLHPHRGATVLTLGILGLAVCCICGIIAWSMGNNDLREIDAGRMDPSGRGLTLAGRICGKISVIIASVIGGIYLILFLIGIVSGLAA